MAKTRWRDNIDQPAHRVRPTVQITRLSSRAGRDQPKQFRCAIGSRLSKFVPQGSHGVVIDPGSWGSQPVIQFDAAEGWIGKLSPTVVKLGARRDQVAILDS